jgi:anti-sigma B factor antagonist
VHGAERVTISSDGTNVLLAVEGDVDAARAPQLLDLVLLTSVVQEHEQVTLDLSQVRFIDSTGLAALVEARNRLEHEGIALTLHHPPPAVAQLLAMSGIEAILAVEDRFRRASPTAEAS